MAARTTRGGLQLLKIAHFCCIALWMGGVAALLPILAAVEYGDTQNAVARYLALRSVAWNVIGWGGIGTVTTGVALAALSDWGLFRHRWVIMKLVAAPALVLFGMFFVEKHMLANLELLKDAAATGDLHAVHRRVQGGLLLMLGGFIGIIALSVVKPWSRVSTGRS